MNIDLFPVIFCYQCLAKQINTYRVFPCAGTSYSAVKRQIKDSKKKAAVKNSWTLYSSGGDEKQINKHICNFSYLCVGVSFVKKKK